MTAPVPSPTYRPELDGPPCVVAYRRRAAAFEASSSLPPASDAEQLRADRRVVASHEHEMAVHGACVHCVRASPYSTPPEAGEAGTYVDEAGRALVARGVWDDDMLLTASQLARKYAMKGGR